MIKAAIISMIILPALIAPQITLASFFYLSPASNQSNLNSDLELKLGLDTSDQVNAITADLTYPDDKLTLDSIVYNPLAFQIGAEEIHSSGGLKISRGSIFGLSGDVTVATIKFKTKALGNANINFTKDSAVPKSSDNSDSFDLASSKGAVVLISDSLTRPTTSTSNLPLSSSSNQNLPTSTLTPDQVKRCDAKKEEIKTRLGDLLDLAGGLKIRFDNIDLLLENYYSLELVPEKKLLPNFPTLQRNIASKKLLVTTQINNLRQDINNFSCINLRTRLTAFKDGVQNLNKSLKEYQSANRDLLQSVQKLASQN